MRKQKQASSPNMRKLFSTGLLCIMATASIPRAYGQAVTTDRPAVSAKPRLLDWRKVPWPSLNYSRIPLSSGGSLYTVPDQTVGRFSLTFIFPSGVYNVPREKRPALGAYVDLLLEGGSSDLTFEQIQQITSQNGITLSTSLTEQGFVRMDASGLSGDFEQALKLVSDLIKKPSFREKALDTWKREKTGEFESLLDAKSLRDQYSLMSPSRDTLVRGKGQYFTTYLERIKPSTIAPLKQSDLIELHKRVATRSNLIVLLGGKFTDKNQTSVGQFVQSLPSGDPAHAIVNWLPERSTVEASEKVKVVVITKPDMKQTSVTGSVLLTGLGELNPTERVHLEIAGEIFSSSSGVVGEDRFSGALRRRSGLSYSAGAQSDEDATWPNTNEASWRFSFQTPTEKSAEGLELAWTTWQDFLKKGVTADEFEATRTVMMNKVMASEITNSGLVALVMSSLLKGLLPPATPFESHLASLEATRSVDDVNKFLKRISDQNQSRAGFVLMGGLSKDEIEDIDDLRFVDTVETLPFEALRSDLLK